MDWLAVIRCVWAQHDPGWRFLCYRAIQLLSRISEVISSEIFYGPSLSWYAIDLGYEQTFIRLIKGRLVLVRLSVPSADGASRQPIPLRPLPVSHYHINSLGFFSAARGVPHGRPPLVPVDKDRAPTT